MQTNMQELPSFYNVLYLNLPILSPLKQQLRPKMEFSLVSLRSAFAKLFEYRIQSWSIKDSYPGS